MIKFIWTCALAFIILIPSEGLSMDSDSEEVSRKTVVAKKKKSTKQKGSTRKRKTSAKSDKQGAKKQKVSKVRQAVTSGRKDKAVEEDVELRVGRGSTKTGGGPGGYHWSVFYNDIRAGKVFINLIDAEPFGEHPSLQIFLNKKSQGKGIGRVAYRQACELSQYDIIYAYMSKKNIPSIRAAAAAGFVVVAAEATRQQIMQWTRKKKVKS